MTEWTESSPIELRIAPQELNLFNTLNCGQAFRWRWQADGWWSGVIHDRAVRLRQDEGVVRAQVFPPISETTSLLSTYLRLDVDLPSLHAAFASSDSSIGAATAAFPGLRVLSQEPQETLLSYVCSTANSVQRISKSVEELSRRYGRHLGTLEGHAFHSFPDAASIASVPQRELREGCGLGWRGDNLKIVAREIAEKLPGWPEELRPLPYGEAKAQLMRLRGIGPKIADCVCLFALGKDEAVPVDTHIWAVAREIFNVQIPTKTLTLATYETVSRLFVDRYGSYAGWAQEYLYMARRAARGRVASTP